MAQSTITFTNSFSDGLTRNLVIGPFDVTDLNVSNLKSAVRALNANPAVISAIYLSKESAPFTQISQVKISTADQVTII